MQVRWVRNSMAKYPEHIHPEGSSEQILPDVSARHTIGHKTQEFTIGSRAAESGGIAAKGSELEASALNMKPRKRKRK